MNGGGILMAKQYNNTHHLKVNVIKLGGKTMLDIVGFDNVTYEQMMLEKEAELEERRKRNEEDFWSQFPEERLDFA